LSKVSEGHQDHQVNQDRMEMMGQKVHLDHVELRDDEDQTVPRDHQEIQESQDHVDLVQTPPKVTSKARCPQAATSSTITRKGHVDLLDHQDPQESKDQRESLDHLVCQETSVPMEPLVTTVHEV